MEKIKLEVAGISAVLYGKRSRRVYLYVHGKNGSAAEAARFARTACPAGWQVLAVDLPEHGARKTARKSWCRGWSPESCRQSTPGCSRCGSISGCMGSASGHGLPCRRCKRSSRKRRCLSPPIVDMEKLILDLMQQAGVTEEQLRTAGEIPTAMGETLSWPYLCWVREHPLHWKVPTQVLYADTDPLTGHTAMEQFRQQTGAHLTILEGGEHWFHTETQLAALQGWESCHI